LNGICLKKRIQTAKLYKTRIFGLGDLKKNRKDFFSRSPLITVSIELAAETPFCSFIASIIFDYLEKQQQLTYDVTLYRYSKKRNDFID
jgi:hypothetical protein